MKSIINGKRYDTQTARKIAEWENSYDRGNFDWYEENLHLTQRGTWFLHGQGNARSPYGEGGRDGLYPGERIRPLTALEARAWLEEKNFAEVIEEHFSDQIEDA